MNSYELQHQLNKQGLNPQADLLEMILSLSDDQQDILINSTGSPSTACKQDVKALAETEQALPVDLIAVCLKHEVSFAAAFRVFFARVNELHLAA